MFSDLLFRLRALFRRNAVEAELDQELHFHRERQCEKYMRSGLTREEALRRVRLEFGGSDQVKEDCREARGIHTLETLWQDVCYGLRTLRKNPGFTSVALLTIALGIGANTAIFSVVYGVLLRPLPYSDSGRLIVLNETTPLVGTVSVSYPNFQDWRSQTRAFSAMAAVASIEFNLAGASQPENISGDAVSANYLSLLGVRPLLGRDFDPSEDRPGAAPVAMLTYPLWQSHFGGQQDVIGRGITLDGRSFTVIGVLPPGFRSTDDAALIEPIGVWLSGRERERGDRGDMVVLGRLAPGIALKRAQNEMEGIAARLAKAYPASNERFGVLLRPIRDYFVSDVRPSILILLGAVMFVLLIACANVANLFLMRSAGRTREIALRIAIGATRGRIVGQMLAESFVLAFFGGMAGLVLAFAGIQTIGRLIPMSALAGASVNLNGAVLLFAACTTMLSALFFGLAPAMQSSRSGVQAKLKESGKATTSSAKQNRWRAALVIAEISLSVILLAGAGLMLKSLYRLLSVDPGFQPDGVLTMQMNLRTAQYATKAARLNYWQQVIDRVRALPGVEHAALGSALPLTNDHSRSDITIEGMTLPKLGSFPHPDLHTVSTDYVRTIGARLLRGREFTDADSETAPRVAMINARLAREFFPHADPIGKRLMRGRPEPDVEPPWLTVVGVVSDTKMYGLENPARLEVYTAFRQSPRSQMGLVVKFRGDPGAVTSAVRSVVASLDRDQPIFGIATMNQLVQDSVATPRITLVLLGVFSGIALVLAGIGIYGVISYSVAQRTQEIGIRMALGAEPRQVMQMILAQGGRIAAAGLLFGSIAAFGLTRWMEDLLFSVSPGDPMTFAAVAIVLTLVAMFACWIPARRTLRVDPAIALRYE